MQIALIAGFFSSIFALMCFVFLPSKYGDSIFGVTVESAQNRLMNLLTPEDIQEKLEIIDKEPKKVLLNALTYGLLFGLIGTLATFKKLGGLSIMVGIILALLGLVLGRIAAEQEYSKWQAKVFEGVPTLVNFFPAFLEVPGITPREALALTLPFLSEPLKSEMWSALDVIQREGKAKKAMNNFAKRLKHPCIDALAIRLASAWDAKVTPDLFDDLMDQIEHLKREAASKKTAVNTAFLALVGVIGCVALLSEFGLPAYKFITSKFIGF
ncbi:conserved hypothetical protein [Desulforamulus reducens MI-1]|uniref:Type II secretion system protein GspF domain-containing protein n=1 Tax=Desulforamulus reducens (strain ATCC BAA-1160 / DSM 100696 / MI-1) TaxID=349161 RepID=A4J328_DESRM|nr:hypothetical protein [Desulforamulus reducens]ABO49481.1 conserved hypothetical protein [Desulforamulus reducens MI-1]